MKLRMQRVWSFAYVEHERNYAAGNRLRALAWAGVFIIADALWTAADRSE